MKTGSGKQQIKSDFNTQPPYKPTWWLWEKTRCFTSSLLEAAKFTLWTVNNFINPKCLPPQLLNSAPPCCNELSASLRRSPYSGMACVGSSDFILNTVLIKHIHPRTWLSHATESPRNTEGNPHHLRLWSMPFLVVNDTWDSEEYPVDTNAYNQ